MKKNILRMAAMALVFGSLGLVSCGDDDPIKPQEENTEQNEDNKNSEKPDTPADNEGGQNSAPHGAMLFAGQASLGVASMDDSWITMDKDTISFQMKGMTSGDITLPVMNYTPMRMTMQSFTIQNAKFTMAQDRTVTFEAGQNFSCTVNDNGTEKNVEGTLNSAVYSHVNGNTFTLDVTFKYGKMPIPATYRGTFTYVSK